MSTTTTTPTTTTCAECGFDWSLTFADGVQTVTETADRLAGLLDGIPPRGAAVRPAVDVWSPAEYLWHVVDVLRFGTERLWTLRLEPDAGVMPWDADLATELRARSPFSLAVGLHALRDGVRAWTIAALEAPADLTVNHPELGPMDAATMVRRNAHELVHHERDIRRGLAAA
jgi:DinB superfamily